MTHLRDDKFIISCAARSGSTMLVLLLGSHSDILAHGEVLHHDSIGAMSGRYGRLRHQDPAISDFLQRYRMERPEAFLYDVVFNADGHKVVGFKFKTDEAFSSDRRFSALHKAILRDRDIKVIRLIRHDALAQYVSFLVTKMTGVMLIRDHELPPVVERFVIDPHRALAYIADVRRREREADKAYAGHRSMTVSYEDLVLDEHPVRGELIRFLGVPPAKLSSTTRKILPKPDEVVLNIEEVRRFIETRGA